MHEYDVEVEIRKRYYEEDFVKVETRKIMRINKERIHDILK